jgi:hypothetical protein
MLAVATLSSLASATTTEPNGTVVPLDSMNGEEQLYTFFSSRGEGIDWLKDAHTTPATFSPLCGFNAQFVLNQAGSMFGLAWYNADGLTAAPTGSDLHTIAPAGSPVGYSFTGTDIRKDPAYKGGTIGFALIGPPTPHYSESKWDVLCTSCSPAAPWVTAVIYQSTLAPNAYYIAFEDGDIGPSSFGNDGDFNDDVYYVTGVTCAGAGAACDTGKPGLCARGATTCKGGTLTCEQSVMPSPKTCNGLDNDCDGVIDDGPCPDGFVCTRGACQPSCRSGEFACTGDLVCDGDICVTPDCKGVSCASDKTCVAGVCVDACTGVKCPGAQTCIAGTCVDLCASLTCGSSEVCVAGLCQPSCACVGCTGGLSCDASGKCVAPACVGKKCAAGTTCDSTGTCVDDCAGATCPTGEVCMAGQCAPAPVSADAGADGSSDASTLMLGDDAGSGGTSDATVIDDAAGGGDGSTGDTDAGGTLGGSKKSSGCGCRTPAAGQSGAASLTLVALGVSLVAARRRRKSA